MSWNASNSPSNAGYSREAYTFYPDREEATASLSGVTTTAPNRAQLITSSAVPYPNEQTQQGQAALTSAPVLAGVPVGAISFYKWQ